MTRLLIVSSSRADLGGLSAVWRQTSGHPELETQVLLTGRHANRSTDYDAAIACLPAGIPVHVAGNDIGGRDAETAARAMGDSVTAIAGQLAEIAPDLLLVLGDRLDIAPAVFAAVPFNIPVAHIHGGELTLGAVDDRVRHAVSKLAHVHFASTTDAAERLCKMGEEPWRIHVTGAPGLDSLRQQNLVERRAFLASVGLPNEPFLLVTVHPETNVEKPLAAFEAVIEAIKQLGIQVLATAANADLNGALINESLQALSKVNSRVVYCDTLGAARYANAFAHAEAMLGNSSSGIIEAGMFGLPVVDVGGRQQGRARGANVAHVDADVKMVKAAVESALGRRFNPDEVSLYGDGHAGQRIAQELMRLPAKARLLLKDFHHGGARFSAPWTIQESLIA
ncbi:UDP-N-acetylglucosamine 2-epimerase (hydrolyzing) [Tardiphaga alba]|uniref:UDP-N-acetylglucosamine 2-epimerase (Hydrolyzing) n=1 Tax=Tardiphaga alba TaxID=340268 RepID=A0ABX8A6R2_9BRAD|nr:UDP-N-acetylglucosamine 2-epimerase [Tardiphaga alba]QUS39122.1 UDP-N-acetylglucosamine 2-epimerase (hydrolyzing) [Tardiphaga alba]